MMSKTKIRLLHAACTAAGGSPALAERLGISEALLQMYLSDAFDLPDALYLIALDVLQESRDAARAMLQ
jgi:hypothetical protein